MCGVCGLAPADPSRVPSRDVITRMTNTIRHRGPDDSGLYIGRGIALGHRRLSIVDLAGGHQPMSSDAGDVHIVYNGEVYNHEAIRKELAGSGISYRTRCDTESVLNLYLQRGQAAVPRLRGMFAFAIWDDRSRELLLARDRFGIKPLYYAITHDGTLCFASEIKALFEVPGVSRELNPAALRDHLANHGPSGPETLFKQVFKLLPGHVLRWNSGNLRVERYWDWYDNARPPMVATDADLTEEFLHLLDEAVRTRLMADVPLGVFLSGGIDSAAITALMHRHLGAGIKSFSVAFSERQANELRYARIAAERFETDHHEVVVGPDDFFASLPRLVWHEDKPIAHPSSIPLYFLAAHAAQHVKVVLTGEGSDELLGGYGRYWRTIVNKRLGEAYHGFVPAPLHHVISTFASLAPRRVSYKLARTFLNRPLDFEHLYLDAFAVFSLAQQKHLLSETMQRLATTDDTYRYQLSRLHSIGDGGWGLRDMLYVDAGTYLEELLMKQDRMSMAASIESRVPFLDHHLAEFAAALPDHMKLRGRVGKHILRAAMRGLLPDQILDRSKYGFPVPFGAWVRTSHTAIVEEYLLGARAQRDLFNTEYVRQIFNEHVKGAVDHSERIWTLLNLELWQRFHVDGEHGPAFERATLSSDSKTYAHSVD